MNITEQQLLILLTTTTETLDIPNAPGRFQFPEETRRKVVEDVRQQQNAGTNLLPGTTGRSLQYRATLIEPSGTFRERPFTLYASNYREAKRMAEGMLDGSVPGSYAILFQTSEDQIEIFSRPVEEEEVPAGK